MMEINDPYKDLEPMIIEISVPADLDKHTLIATIKCQNPLDCIILSAWIITQIRQTRQVEPIVKIIQ